ncbi:MAG TPA: hypothetical protein VNL15_06260 [Dehalococcoidia bacterium]|nr:hypothetical protein [Dehalococcoidia bacterium]
MSYLWSRVVSGRRLLTCVIRGHSWQLSSELSANKGLRKEFSCRRCQIGLAVQLTPAEVYKLADALAEQQAQQARERVRLN